MPAYNAEKYIRSSIDSILNQTFSDFILLIIDDSSVDGTASIIRSYTDDRIVYVKNEINIGVKETLNKGIRMIDTEYIVRMDADDIAVPERLEWQLSFMDSNLKIGVSGGNYELFGDENKVINLPLTHEEIKSKLFVFSGFCHPTLILRTQVLKENNIFYGSPVAYNDLLGHKINEIEDYGLWHRLKQVTLFANIDRILIRYRKEGQNISGRNMLEVNERKLAVYYYLLGELDIIDPSRDEVLFLFNFHYYKEDPDIKKIRKYRNFLDNLIKMNSAKKVYDPGQFEKIVERIWEQYFYFLTTFRIKYLIEYWSVCGKIKKQQLIYTLKFKLSRAVKAN
jgi:glycosyltransferase involved in cell wall biosynthesis